MVEINADCYDQATMPSFEVEHRSLKSFIKKFWLPSRCFLLVDKSVPLVSMHFSGGDWYDFFIQIAVQQHLHITRSRHFIGVTLPSSQSFMWPRVQELVDVHFQKPSELVEQLKLPSGISSNVVSDDALSKVMVNAPVDKIDNLVARIHTLDQQQKNYHVEAKVLFLREGGEQHLGLRWQARQGALLAWPIHSRGPWWMSGIDHLAWDNAINNDEVVIEAKPHLYLLEGEKAFIESGDEWPYVTKDKKNSLAAVQFKKASLSLGITVKSRPHNRVALALELNQAQVSHQTQSGLPVMQTQNASLKSNILLGETMVVGGVYRWAFSRVNTSPRFPSWLRRWLWSSQEKKERQQLLLILRVNRV